MIPNTYTVESVTSGHPDKVCDQISDVILDECLRQDPHSRVAVETFGSHGMIIVAGEVTSKAYIDTNLISTTYRSIGYNDDLSIIRNIKQQSQEISDAVDLGGAGDQGIMYGFATDETPEMLPIGVVLANELASDLDHLRYSREILWLKPDGKVQITISDGKVSTVIVSCQHDASISLNEVRETIRDNLLQSIFPYLSKIPCVLINPAGTFTCGGFSADTGLTGRKIMVDTYGGVVPSGGGCFSGKDSTKVDRSAAYMCRYVARKIVQWGYARECLVSVAYAIGKEDPVMLTAVDEDGHSVDGVLNSFDFRPKAIIELLDLRRPIYFNTACYGHFGRDIFPWES